MFKNLPGQEAELVMEVTSNFFARNNKYRFKMVNRPLREGDKYFTTGDIIESSKFGVNNTFIGREYTLAVVDSQLNNPQNY